MKIKQLKQKGKLSFEITGTTSSFVNTLRRFAISEVPVMAIETVEFWKNNSALYDEIIASRLGLIPLKTDLKSYTEKDKCSCKGNGCAKCTVTLTLKAVGPKTVYASDLKSNDPKVVPVYPEMAIVKLDEGQELEFQAEAILGKGKTHMKWSPCLAYYKNIPSVSVKKQPSNAKEVAEACPVNVFSLKGGKLEVENRNACHFCNACLDIQQGGEIKITPKEDSFVFTVEPWGQLSATDILKQSIAAYDAQLDEFASKVKSLK